VDISSSEQLKTENNKLRRQLQEFHRKQSEFAFLLHSGAERCGLSSAMAPNTSFLPSVYADIITQEKKNQQELAEVRQKIEELSSVTDDTSQTSEVKV
jgi:prephenate dehydrogenase